MSRYLTPLKFHRVFLKSGIQATRTDKVGLWDNQCLLYLLAACKTREKALIGNLTVSLVIPCRNEASHLPQIVNNLPEFYDQVVLVSNASTDDTYEVACCLMEQESRLVVLRDDRTHGGIGYGYAHMSGMDAATGDVVVCVDGDGTYPIDETPRLLREMLERGNAFATCSRYPDRSIPIRLQLGVRILNLEVFTLYGIRLADSLSGMWVFLRDALPHLGLTEGNWNLSPQIKINAFSRLGNLACELRNRQAPHRLGVIKQHYVRTGLSHVCWIARNRLAPRKGVLQPD